MVVFSEEVLIKQSIHIRNKVNEIIEINGGYTATAESEVNNLISKIKYETKIEVSKKGKLNYGKKIEYKIILYYNRKLPFFKDSQRVSYDIVGEYYNASY